MNFTGVDFASEVFYGAGFQDGAGVRQKKDESHCVGDEARCQEEQSAGQHEGAVDEALPGELAVCEFSLNLGYDAEALRTCQRRPYDAGDNDDKNCVPQPNALPQLDQQHEFNEWNNCKKGDQSNKHIFWLRNGYYQIRFFISDPQVVFSLMLKNCLPLFALLISVACESPFTTREAELPDGSSSTFLNPTSPDIVFVNLRIAFDERNVENYIRTFVDSTRSSRRFKFLPDEGVAATRPGTFLNWSLEDERRYLIKLFQATSPDSVLRLTFVEDKTDESANSATVTQNYRLTARHSRQELGLGPEVLGQAIFYLERNETGDWSIHRWEDFKVNTADQSWSELKAFFQ